MTFGHETWVILSRRQTPLKAVEQCFQTLGLSSSFNLAIRGADREV